jgi:hypothetical protein
MWAGRVVLAEAKRLGPCTTKPAPQCQMDGITTVIVGHAFSDGKRLQAAIVEPDSHEM